MPPKKSYKKKTNKTNATWAKTKTGPKSSPFPLGRTLYTTLKTTQFVNVNPATYFFSNTFRANSLYDPDWSQVGNPSPLGFDECAALYQKYKVFHCSLKLKWMSSTGLSTTVCLIARNTTTHTYGSVAEAIAAPGSQSRVAMGAGAQSRATVLTMNRKPRDIIGVSKIQYADEDYGAAVTTNPAHDAYITCYVASNDGSTNVLGTMIVEITYKCMFYDRKQLLLS